MSNQNRISLGCLQGNTSKFKKASIKVRCQWLFTLTNSQTWTLMDDVDGLLYRPSTWDFAVYFHLVECMKRAPRNSYRLSSCSCSFPKFQWMQATIVFQSTNWISKFFISSFQVNWRDFFLVLFFCVFFHTPSSGLQIILAAISSRKSLSPARIKQ